jgi:hypothetical protein
MNKRLQYYIPAHFFLSERGFTHVPCREIKSLENAVQHIILPTKGFKNTGKLGPDYRFSMRKHNSPLTKT